jgi:hypothetical protein
MPLTSMSKKEFDRLARRSARFWRSLTMRQAD